MPSFATLVELSGIANARHCGLFCWVARSDIGPSKLVVFGSQAPRNAAKASKTGARSSRSYRAVSSHRSIEVLRSMAERTASYPVDFTTRWCVGEFPEMGRPRAF